MPVENRQPAKSQLFWFKFQDPHEKKHPIKSVVGVIITIAAK